MAATQHNNNVTLEKRFHLKILLSPITHYLIHVLEGEGADWAEHKVGRVFKRKTLCIHFFLINS